MTELRDKKLFLLDMDGTIYLGNRLFPDTLPFLRKIKENGASYLFLTNNSSKSVSAYVKKLASIGVEASPEEFLTSTYATILYLKKHHADAKIYAFGTESFKTELKGSGLQITDKLEDGISVLVMGFDTELTFQKLEDACILLGRGVEYIATNPDFVCPTEYGYVPDCGSVAGMLKNATGRMPHFIGKPEPEMILLALDKMGVTRDDAVMIGDRLYTDIASGVRAGIDTVFVLSGEGTPQDCEKSHEKPTYMLPGVGTVLKMISK